MRRLVFCLALAAPGAALAGDAVRVAGEIVKQGGVNLGDVVAGQRVRAGLRVLTANELKTADVGACEAIPLGGFDIGALGHPPPCRPLPNGLFDSADLASIVSHAVGNSYIVPILGYRSAFAGEVGGVASPIQFLGGLDSPSPAFVDLDDDLDLDLALVDGHGLLRVFRNEGAATPDDLVYAGPVTDVGGGTFFEISLAFADLDDDGDLDAVTGVNNGVYWRRNVGSPSTPEFESSALLANTNGFGARVTVGDVDGDGLTDVLAGHFGGAVDFVRNTGSASVPAFADGVALIAAPGLPIPSLVDIDDDGDPDLFLSQGGLRFFRNNTVGMVPDFDEEAAPFDPGGFPTGVAPGDFDGDGDFDFLTASSIDPHFLYTENTGTAASPAFGAGGVVVRPGGGPIYQRTGITYPRFAQLAGSPATDLLISAYNAGVHVLRRVGFSTGVRLAAPEALLDAEDGDAAIQGPCGALDLDGDGDADLLCARSHLIDARIFVYENTSPEGGLEFRGRGPLQDGGGDLVVDARPGAYDLAFDAGDLDGDGDADIFASTYSDEGTGIWLLENLGVSSLTGAFGPAEAVVLRGANPVFNTIRPTLVDLDFDGDLDVLYEQSGSNFAGILLNVGAPDAPVLLSYAAIPYPEPTVVLGSHGYAAPVDVHGDGDLDLFLGNTAGGLLLWESVQAD